MEHIDRTELLRRAAYHASEARRLIEEVSKRHEKAAEEFPDLGKRWLSGKQKPSMELAPCIVCGQHHFSNLPCPHMMTVC